MKTACRTDVRTYIVGIQYESPDEDKGFFDIQRRVTLQELAEEVADYIKNGKTSFPPFPPDANAEVFYVWDMDDQEDGDAYPDLMAEIQKLPMMKVA